MLTVNIEIEYEKSFIVWRPLFIYTAVYVNLMKVWKHMLRVHVLVLLYLFGIDIAFYLTE